MHRGLVYIFLLNVPSFSSRYFNKIKRTSRLGRLLALSLEILGPCHCIKFVVFIVALGIVPQKSVVNSIVLVKKWQNCLAGNPSLAFMITKFIQRTWLCMCRFK